MVDGFITTGFSIVLGLCILLNFFSLPGNWIMIGLLALWSWLAPDPGNMGIIFFVITIALSLSGEIFENVMQLWGAKKYGTSKMATFCSFIGAIAGAIICMPFLFGLGAIIGAFIGAGIACYSMEMIRGKNREEAWIATKGVLIGKGIGMAAKCGIGVAIFFIATRSMATIQ